MENLPIIDSLESLNAAFEQIQTEHPSLTNGKFLAGNYADLVAESRNNIKYPVLLLETPNIRFFDNHADYRIKYFVTSFVVLKNHKTKDKKDRLIMLDELATIAQQIIERLDYEAKRVRNFHFSLSGTNLEEVPPTTQDNDIGWRYRFEIGVVKGVFHQAENWL
jgi:hypothetical protein